MIEGIAFMTAADVVNWMKEKPNSHEGADSEVIFFACGVTRHIAATCTSAASA